MKKTLVSAAIATAAALSTALSGQASSQVVSGWIGPTGTVGGYSYLHQSTIDNGNGIKASSKIYTVDGRSAPPAYMGVRARLFKSGSLCELVDFKYNTKSVGTWTVATPGAGCGTGSYNSHGFVSAFDPDNGYSDFVTFPTNPVNWTAPAAAAKATATAAPTDRKTNERGQTYGSGENAKTDSDLPDLVSAIADNGRTGYIKATELTRSKALAPQEARRLPVTAVPGGQTAYSAPARSVPVYNTDGVTQIGSFTIK